MDRKIGAARVNSLRPHLFPSPHPCFVPSPRLEQLEALEMATLNFAYPAEEPCVSSGLLYSANTPESYKFSFFSLTTKAAIKTVCKSGFYQKVSSYLGRHNF